MQKVSQGLLISTKESVINLTYCVSNCVIHCVLQNLSLFRAKFSKVFFQHELLYSRTSYPDRYLWQCKTSVSNQKGNRILDRNIIYLWYDHTDKWICSSQVWVVFFFYITLVEQRWSVTVSGSLCKMWHKHFSLLCLFSLFSIIKALVVWFGLLVLIWKWCLFLFQLNI